MTAYTSESAFWYYVGHKLWNASTNEMNESLNPMNVRAAGANIPVEWKPDKAIPWATCCRAYILSKQNISNIGRLHFQAFVRGMTASIGPRGFFDHALHKIMGNVQNPALPNRIIVDSVADTFAAASMTYKISDDLAESIHGSILEWVVTDQVIHAAALLAISTRKDFWEESVDEYGMQRPGWLRRNFTSADKWLFSKHK